MHLKNQPPVFVPNVYWSELDKLSKATLMDIAWDYAMQISGESEQRPRQIMDELRKRADLIQIYRRRAKANGGAS